MTVTSNNAEAIFTGNSATTSWATGIYAILSGDIVCYRRDISTGLDTLLVESTDYSVTNVGSSSGVTINYPLTGSPMTSSYKLVVVRSVSYTQTTDIQNADGFYPAVLEGTFDTQEMQIQQVKALADRSLKFPSGEGLAPSIPAAAQRAGRVLAFDSNGDPVVGTLVGSGVYINGNINIFSTRAELVTELGSATNRLSDGDFVQVNGILAVIDSTATGTKSNLHDLGMDGCRFNDDYVPTRWWTEDATTDVSTLVNAANTYADAWAGSEPDIITLVMEGLINLAEPVTLGTSGTGVGKSFNIDATNCIPTAISGGSLTSSDMLITIQNCARSLIEFSQVECDHICGGITIENCTNSIFNGAHISHFNGKGYWVKGGKSSPTVSNSSGSVFIKITGTEWTSGEAEFDTNSNYVSDGIVNDSFDVKFFAASTGWCKRAIVNNAGSCEYQYCHPFNGNAHNSAYSYGRFCFWNTSTYNVHINNMYADNGYIVDEGGGLIIDDLIVLDLKSTLTKPYVRIRTDVTTASTNYIGTMTGVHTDIGWYTGDFVEDFSNENTDYNTDLSGGGYDSNTIREVALKRLKYYNIGTETPDELHMKPGSDTTPEIVYQYLAGTGDVSIIFKDGYIAAQSGSANNGEFRVATNHQTGIGATTAGTALLFYSNDTLQARFEAAGTFRPENDDTNKLGLSTQRWAEVHATEFYPGPASTSLFWTAGAGSPEGVVTASVGALYSRSDGGAGTTLYVKESGTGNTGWVAK